MREVDMFGVTPSPPPPRARSRARERAIRSHRSHIKHNLIWRVAVAQTGAFRVSHMAARMLIVDANAGDGDGVPLPQMDFFEANNSMPTPEQVVRMAGRFGCDVLLCERDAKHRAALVEKYPSIPIIRDNADMRALTRGYDYVLVISDPCGPAGHNFDMLAEISRRQRCDLIVVLNEAPLVRIHSTSDPMWATSRARYPRWMLDPCEWTRRLGRRHLSVSGLNKPTANFHYRVLVIADHLADAATRQPFKVTM